MRELIRPAVAALSIACLAASFAALSCSSALAQAKQAPAKQMAPTAPPAMQQPPAIKQIALTDKQIDSMLAADKEIEPIVEKLPENSKPDPKIVAQLEAIAKKNGFASYDEFNNVVDNVSLVFSGIDPATKKYVGNDAVIKAQIAQVQADKKMSAKDKKDALADLNEAAKAPEPTIENKGNIDLVVKNYDKLAATMSGGPN
jgi:hypothetical protein